MEATISTSRVVYRSFVSARAGNAQQSDRGAGPLLSTFSRLLLRAGSVRQAQVSIQLGPFRVLGIFQSGH